MDSTGEGEPSIRVRRRARARGGGGTLRTEGQRTMTDDMSQDTAPPTVAKLEPLQQKGVSEDEDAIVPAASTKKPSSSSTAQTGTIGQPQEVQPTTTTEPTQQQAEGTPRRRARNRKAMTATTTVSSSTPTGTGEDVRSATQPSMESDSTAMTSTMGGTSRSARRSRRLQSTTLATDSGGGGGDGGNIVPSRQKNTTTDPPTTRSTIGGRNGGQGDGIFSGGDDVGNYPEAPGTSGAHSLGPSFLVSIIGQVESAEIPFHDSIYCKYSIVYGDDWSVSSGLQEGVSQISTKYLGTDRLVWNFPIEIAFRSTNPFGWPRITLSLYGLDILGRDVPRGYGSCLLPFTPGMHNLDVDVFVPKTSSFSQECLGWILGRRAEYVDPNFVSQGQGREVTRVQSQGSVKLSITVTTKDFGLHGYRCTKA